MGNGNTVFVDPNIESQPKSQPQDIYGVFNMIQTADNVAEQYPVTREEQDAFALESQKRAVAAIDAGRFKEEIVEVVIPQRKKEPIVFSVDEYPKRDTSMEKLSKLRPIFTGGTVTAGNASGRNDGACAVLLMSEEKAAELQVKPMGRIMGTAAAGVDPRVMGTGPIAATRKLLKKLDMQMENFELFEINEAFAAQSVACAKELKINPELLNVNGGAIALGHPLGCSGSSIVTTMLYEMRRRKVRYGLASICIAGGLGMAMAVEALEG